MVLNISNKKLKKFPQCGYFYIKHKTRNQTNLIAMNYYAFLTSDFMNDLVR